jgi:hypothetical protein
LQKAATKLIAKQAGATSQAIEDAGVALSRSLVPANPVSIAEGLSRVARIRNAFGVSANKNIAFAEVDFGTGVRLDLQAVSGESFRKGFVPPPGTAEGISELQRRFITQATGNNPRRFDSENIILEHLANTIPTFASGRIRLFSELPVCVSCNGVIDQFRRMFHNIELIVTSGY